MVRLQESLTYTLIWLKVEFADYAGPLSDITVSDGKANGSAIASGLGVSQTLLRRCHDLDSRMFHSSLVGTVSWISTSASAVDGSRVYCTPIRIARLCVDPLMNEHLPGHWCPGDRIVPSLATAKTQSPALTPRRKHLVALTTRRFDSRSRVRRHL
jgi:hypothetical protein